MPIEILVITYIVVGLCLGIVAIRRMGGQDAVLDGLTILGITIGWLPMVIMIILAIPFMGVAKVVTRTQ